jgi:hypothetical protein
MCIDKIKKVTAQIKFNILLKKISMRKALPIAGILTLLFFLPAMTQNTVDPSHIKQLVSQHAAKLGIEFSDLQNYRVASAYYDETTGLTMAYLTTDLERC